MELWFKRSLQLKTHYNQVFLHTTLSICVRDIKGYSWPFECSRQQVELWFDEDLERNLTLISPIPHSKYLQLLLLWCFFKKGAQVGGQTWDLFDFRLFSLTSSALDHSATAPPKLLWCLPDTDFFVERGFVETSKSWWLVVRGNSRKHLFRPILT